ncbi:MAG TPA: hypothetical protein VMM12_01275 [Longimicrobiales bacterium]|nr:hypothetical protein [Longimicrobiales bacterium]
MFSKGLSEGARKRVELAVAVAQEKLLSTHVDHSLDLIALIDEQVSFTDALEIYGRLLRLDDDDAQNITTRSLAILGEKAGDAPVVEPKRPPPRPEPEDEDREPNGRSLFGGLRNRLRGRVNEELRRKIEFIAARTEVALIRTHTDNAVQFVGILHEELEEKEAVELYLDALDVRESIAEVTYFLALSRLADDILPAHGSSLAARRRGAGMPTHAEVAGPLHASE